MQITNTEDVTLALAVWLVNDDYDYDPATKTFSATTLMKPLKHLILGNRIPPEQRSSDVTDYVARQLGHAIHFGIERAWRENYQANLKRLGYPDEVIERIRINPDPRKLTDSCIPVYIEQRSHRKLGGYTISGKPDLVIEGILHDNKSTSAFAWMYGTRDEEYQLQGSIYRWLDPERITEDFIRVCFVFTDWKRSDARSNPKYPPHRVMHKDIPLLSLEQTEHYLRNRLQLILQYWHAAEADMPPCSDEELWLSEPQHRYYLDPAKTSGRSTRNFTNLSEAQQYMASRGNRGVIITVPPTAKRCGYCPAFDICEQKNSYEHEI